MIYFLLLNSSAICRRGGSRELFPRSEVKRSDGPPPRPFFLQLYRPKQSA